MKRSMQRVFGYLAAGLVVIGVGTERALACAVCFGDPSSDMAKGAVAGVVALLGFIGFVLVGVAGTGIYFVRRGRRVNATSVVHPTGDSSGH